MKTEKTFRIENEEWKLSFQSFTHCSIMNLRCKFYITRDPNYKSTELRISRKHNNKMFKLLLFSSHSPLICKYPQSIKEVKIEILKFLTEY